MKISPVSSAGASIGAVTGPDTQVARVQPNIRSLRMNTNATPDAIIPGMPETPVLPTPDTIDKAPEATNQPLSPQAAALAKQRRSLQLKERELADREKALQGQTPAQGDPEMLVRLKSEPLKVLLEQGVTYQQLTKAILDDQARGNPEIYDLKAKIADLETGFDKKLTERDQQAEQQALAEMRRIAQQLIAQGDEYALVRETRSIPHVMQLIERTYRKSGEVLDVSEALQLVENELVKEGLKVAKLSKVQSQLAPQAPVLPPRQQQSLGMRTLSNRDTASVPMSAKQRALAAFYGQLKR